LGTHDSEALLRGGGGSRASKKCVPKPELGNEKTREDAIYIEGITMNDSQPPKRRVS
jgi:hypothetical protein